MNNWNVLVIEDDADSADVVSRILRYHKVVYRVATSAEEALSQIDQEMPNLLIVDLALPEMDGWGFLKEMRGNPATAALPAVAITAFHSIEVAQKAIQAGFNAYFSKPIEATSFVRELERVMSGSL